MKEALKIVAVLAALQALLLAAWFGVERRRSAPEAAGGGAHAGQAPPGQLAPALTLRRADGAQVELSSLRGRPVVLHFWATWCKPCREELPALLRLAGDASARVLAVSVDRQWPAVRSFLGGAPPPAVLLASGDEVEQRFNVRQLPVTFLLDADGRIRKRLDGAQPWSERSLSELLRAAAPASAPAPTGDAEQ